jgi:hypothetical protein
MARKGELSGSAIHGRRDAATVSLVQGMLELLDLDIEFFLVNPNKSQIHIHAW